MVLQDSYGSHILVEEIAYPTRELRRNEAMTHQPVTVEAVTVAKSNKYTKLIRGTLIPTIIPKKKPSVI